MKTSLRQPTAEPAGLRVNVKMLVSDWPASAVLGYLVLDPVTGAMIEDGGRAGLSGAPGVAVSGQIAVDLPEEDGRYRVLISPVEEGVAWLYQQGSDALVMDVEVKAGAAHVIELRNTTAGSRALQRVARVVQRALIYPFRVLWEHHSLISSMVRRDIHGRYRGSVAGLFWTVINPLLMMLTYSLVFGGILKVRFGPNPDQSMNFPLYLIAGMLPWLAFNEALGRSAGSVLEHRMLVKRVVFPIEIVPVNITLAGLVSEFFGSLVFLALLLAVRHSLPPTVLYLPVILVPQILLTVGLCWFLAGLGVFLRDVGQFLTFFLTLLFFCTPICYSEQTGIPGLLRKSFQVNPVYVLVRAYRAVFLEGTAPDWRSLVWLSVAGLAAFIFGFAWFYKSRRAFADVL
jgi:lipopolysaccharide transport system permease protein